jgi:RNA polymerase sigma-70 factor (ECF subfamily)
MAGLLAAARAGDRDALGAALQRCREYLLAIAQRQVNPALRAKGGASDVVQQTFLDAQRDFAAFAGVSADELRAWLRRLLLNNAADFAKGFQGAEKRRLDRETELPDAWRSDAQGDLPGDVPTPSVDAIATEHAERIRALVQTLPEDYRQVIAWRYEEEHSFAEIAERMGRSENAVRKLWFRAIEKLEQGLGGSIDGR